MTLNPTVVLIIAASVAISIPAAFQLSDALKKIDRPANLRLAFLSASVGLIIGGIFDRIFSTPARGLELLLCVFLLAPIVSFWLTGFLIGWTLGCLSLPVLPLVCILFFLVALPRNDSLGYGALGDMVWSVLLLSYSALGWLLALIARRKRKTA